MSKQKGLFKFKGTLNGNCYYKLNGQYVVRKAVGPSKERINTDPAFVNVKSNNQEFAAASKLSKAIRQGLGNNAIAFRDTYMASRLTGCCRKIIQKGRGALGQRAANLFNNPKALLGFQLKKDQPFHQIYTAEPVVTTNANRSAITVNIPISTINHHQQTPENATHFQLTAALSRVSNILWEATKDEYHTENKKHNATGTTIQTIPLLCKIEHHNISMQLQTPNQTNTPLNVANTVWLGITYLKHQNNAYQILKTAQTMQCISIL